MYEPVEIDGKWFAEYTYKEYYTNKTKKILAKDMNGDILNLVSKNFATDWCNTKNELENIF